MIGMKRLHTENAIKHVLVILVTLGFFPSLRDAILGTPALTGEHALSGMGALATIQVAAIIPFYSYSFAITDPRKLYSRIMGYVITGFYLFVIMFTISGMTVIVGGFGEVAKFFRLALMTAATACIIFDVQDFTKVGQDIFSKEYFEKEIQ